jgi:hypothetical protein
MTAPVARRRDELYRADAPNGIPSWVADQVNALSEGWVPVASDSDGDGWLRVTYEAGPRVRVRRPPPGPVVEEPLADESARGLVAAILAVLLIVAGFAIAVRP